MVEFQIVALFAMLPLCLGMLQSALLMTENHHVDHAAFMAARAGAMTSGDAGAMRNEFARVMTPLFSASDEPLDRSNALTRVPAMYARSVQDFALHGTMDVLSPDATAQQDHAISRENRRVIPNDSLEHRSAAPGSRSGISLQEANILQVRFTYCRPLVVPFVRQMLVGLLRLIDAEPGHQRCYVANRIPIVSIGTAPMHSDFILR